MDENTQAKFDEKLKELLNVAKKKKNVIDAVEVNDFFSDMQLEEEQFDKILETLEKNNIDVLAGIPIAGICVVSAIMKAESPMTATVELKVRAKELGII